jgi:hypothetical protein
VEKRTVATQSQQRWCGNDSDSNGIGNDNGNVGFRVHKGIEECSAHTEATKQRLISISTATITIAITDTNMYTMAMSSTYFTTFDNDNATSTIFYLYIFHFQGEDGIQYIGEHVADR